MVDQLAAVNSVIKEYASPLNCGAVDPDDPDMGIEALRAALHDAGIDEVIAEVQVQYDAWKAAQE